LSYTKACKKFSIIRHAKFITTSCALTKIALQISNFPADSPIYTATKRLMKKTSHEIASGTPHGNGISELAFGE
jgi:hypothetical protein